MASINYSAAELEELLNSVKPRLTYGTKTTNLASLSDLTGWLNTCVSDMAVYGARFLLFKPTATFAPYASGRVYGALLWKAGSSDNAMVMIVQESGAGSSTYPNATYIRKNGGTWGSPQTIAQ